MNGRMEFPVAKLARLVPQRAVHWLRITLVGGCFERGFVKAEAAELRKVVKPDDPTHAAVLFTLTDTEIPKIKPESSI